MVDGRRCRFSTRHLFIVTVLTLSGCTFAMPSLFSSAVGRCERISIPMCQKLPYNETFFPNMMGHETQREASVEIQQFSPLIAVNCSPELRHFLCSLYAPVCVSVNGKPKRLVPCRHNCKRVRKGCIDILKKYGFKWPKSMRCSKFPRKKFDNLCVDWSSKKGAKKDRKNRRGKKGKRRNKKKKNLRKKQRNQDKGVIKTGDASKTDGVIKSTKGKSHQKGKKNKKRRKMKKRKRKERKQKRRNRDKVKKASGSSQSGETAINGYKISG